jgi:hypothetical protein
MPTDPENVCLSGKSGSDADIAKPTRLTVRPEGAIQAIFTDTSSSEETADRLGGLLTLVK